MTNFCLTEFQQKQFVLFSVSIKKLLEIGEFSTVIKYKVNTEKAVVFC